MEESKIVESFFHTIGEIEPLQRKKAESYFQAMSQEEKTKLVRRISFFLLEEETIKSLAESYIAFCDYFVNERYHFAKTGTYRYHSLEETQTLYEDHDYMHNCMIGLCLASYMWQIQRDIMRFFVEACKQAEQRNGRYLEIGVGHGEYFVSAIENMEFDQYIGVDISMTSVKMTEKYADYVIGEKKDFTVLHKDFFDYNSDETFQGIVMGEVLEHVEEPLKFLKKIHELADKDAFIFLSTAINSPYPDHIYHFHNVEEIYELFRQSHLRVKKEICTTAEGISLERAAKKKYDIMVGFILEKESN